MPLNTAALKSRQQLTYDIIEVTFETQGPFTFTAGQFVTFKVADKMPPCFRAYSISSIPKQNGNIFETCLKIIPNGRGSTWLNSLKIGDKVEFMGPNGNLAFRTQQGKTAIFIATGTGVTPFKSIIKDELTKGHATMHLIFGLRYIKDIFYKDYFEKLAEKYKNFTFEITLSRPEDDTWKGKVGRVTDILNKMPIDTRSTEFYICGLKDMVNEMATILKTKGVPKNAINMEKYD